MSELEDLQLRIDELELTLRRIYTIVYAFHIVGARDSKRIRTLIEEVMLPTKARA